MSGEDLRQFIEVIIDYIPLVYPGGISVFIYNFCNAVSGKDIRLFIVKAICVSYLYDIVLKTCGIHHLGNDLWYNSVLCIVAVFSPFLLYKIIKSKKLSCIFQKLNIFTSTIDNDYEEMCSGDEYNYLRIYVKDRPIIYEGYVRTYERDNNKRQYIILTDYKIVSYDEKTFIETPIRGFSGDENDKIIVYGDDIKIMEKQSYKRISKQDN